MRYWRIIYWVFLLCSAPVTMAEVPAETVVKVNVSMRDNGYTMGDFIRMQVNLTLKDQQKIDPDSLPLVGRVKPWLDLNSLSIKTLGNKTSIEITWQIFATVEIAQQLKTPEIIIKTLEKKPQNISIPAQSFFYSPVLAYPLGDVKRRADLPPLRFDEQRPKQWTFILLGLAILTGFIWCWLKDRLPWLPYSPGPLTQLARRLNGWPASQYPYTLQGNGLDVDYLRDIHRALNASAGESLYPHTLQKLFIKAPYLEAEKIAISVFFHASWQQFYATTSFKNEAHKEFEIDPKTTLAWIQNVALAERLFRRNMRKKIETKTRKK